MKIIENLNYRQWQRRNKEIFSQLDRLKQKKIRERGYCNKGWDNVKKSWEILNNTAKESSLFDYKLKKGDLVGAINHSILEAEQAQKKAKKALENLETKRRSINKKAEEALTKYQLL
ncbi:MAG: hypothetical protein SAJ12_16900 [Jaaginema sp. PMC 1079.18]|nr:hypothetical protein [Jaaginema sp. PMC 1080.18]MEC4852662.1 hypothetical protein [Jaaginema sp. PMC 1079.18]MEC4864468.1 hypothetical protein [Jaaginema sp. PMC 1078.18]